MDSLTYTLNDRRILKNTERQTVILTDNNMINLVIKIPKIIDGVDVTHFNYVVKFLVDENYIEKIPVVVADTEITLTTPITQDLTDEYGNLRFSVTGYMEDQRFSSAIASQRVGETIRLGDYKPIEMVEVWLEEIRETVKNAREIIQNEVKESLEEVADEAIDNMKDDIKSNVDEIVKNEFIELKDYNNLDNRPSIEGIVLEDDKMFSDFGLVALDEDELLRLF